MTGLPRISGRECIKALTKAGFTVKRQEGSHVFLWSLIFFGLRSPGLALVEIVLLWVLILATLVQFLRVTTVGGLLLIPYLLWVTFAAVLNDSVWQMNR